jgi:two-component system C4-dicarboxylate transport sensor histidine kinase DctB
VAGFVIALLVLSEILQRREANQTNNRAQFFAGTVEASLARLDHLPFIIAQDPGVQQALQSGNGAAINLRLEEFATRANAEAIFLLDTSGLTIASSNHAAEQSFVGESYRFRPYFQDAVTGGHGRFFAIGATTGRPGYFVSDPVMADGAVIGVVTVKVGLQTLDQSWRDTGERILVTNEAGVVILASEAAHLFGTLRPLTAATRQSIAQGQQFLDRPLDPLDWQIDSAGRAALDGVGYLLSPAPIDREGWQVHLLTDLAGIRQQAVLAALVLLALALGLILALTGFRSAQLDRALALSNADRATLNAEIEVRRETETALRRAQDALARNSRLAALGQLAASITHELGQPISAMRNYLTAEEIATGAAPDTLNTQLGGLVDRMARITSQLRFFATPAAIENTVFDLHSALCAATELVQHKAANLGVTLTTPAPTPAHPISGSQHRFEQVLVNVLRNGIEAATGPNPVVNVQILATKHEVAVQITDTGTGLGTASLDDLTEPFVTTKSSGDGMGLGLAISAQIMAELGGSMAADSTPAGATFILTLPLAEAPHG